ncbi:MAG TPA: hypothetical protein VFB34_01035 [Chloroflexota bacterium]|nr:hypothetical protein [Chloroflexota bacterium]
MNGKGAVVGGIYPCVGLQAQQSGVPKYAAGTVTVLRGHVHFRHRGGQSNPVFPRRLSARVTLRRDESYHFLLPPGHYVLKETSLHSDVEPWTSVVVVQGATKHVNIPNICM